MSLRQYELMIILDPEIEERTVAPSLDKYLTVITTEGGSVDKVDIWGRRRLAYEIQKKSEGIYAVVNFTASPATAKELDRQLGLNEVVLRTKILRVEAARLAAEAAAAEETAATDESAEPAAS
ncbi:30S ribosomal protein S6 [Flavimobilis marinus]|uniref:Small ribosomal subunit protein bS6 n=1 Tax=Flavimobilis marinus TaxID=285351 RepID=A0A1I2HUS7_9MICO|nr:30S ribosomal protein S6 [Flavimobilis marinus]SFF33110.1 small subunit ribosomal protein S6 [Flavimobilis marinus]